MSKSNQVEIIKKPATWLSVDKLPHVWAPAVTFKRHADGRIDYHCETVDAIKRYQVSRFDPNDAKYTLKPRVETSAKVFASVVKDIGDSPTGGPGRYKSVEGKVHGGQWRLVKTDGYRAVFEKCASDTADNRAQDMTEGGWQWTGDESYHTTVIRDPEFYLAVKRAMVVMPLSKRIELEIGKHSMQLLVIKVSARDPFDGAEFEQTLRGLGSVESTDTIKFAMNAEHLLNVLGVWPLRMMWKSDIERVVFAPGEDDNASVSAGDSWRAVIMPMYK